MENGEEATCKNCGVWFPKCELTDGYCIPCYEEAKHEERVNEVKIDILNNKRLRDKIKITDKAIIFILPPPEEEKDPITFTIMGEPLGSDPPYTLPDPKTHALRRKR